MEGQPSVQIQSQTGPLSYRLSTGERAHARRLVAGQPGRESGACVAGDGNRDPQTKVFLNPETIPAYPIPQSPVTPAGLPVSGNGTPSPGRRVGERRDRVESPELVLPRRSARKVNEPDRYSPSKYQ